MPDIRVQHVWPIPNANHPQILYWFFNAESVFDRRYLADVEFISRRTPFDLVCLTQQGQAHKVSFYDFDVMHPVVSALVKRAHELGIRVGMQFFPREDLPITVEHAQALAVDTVAQLDGEGRAVVTAAARGTLGRTPFAGELLGVYLFRPTGDPEACEYQAGSVVEAASCTRVLGATDRTVTVEIRAPRELAGCAAYVLTAHYYRYGDLFGEFLPGAFAEALDRYADIPLDATVLDEFGYFYLPAPWDRTDQTPPVRERFYGRAMAAFYERHTGKAMVRDLFDMRYSPAGQPQARAAAINRYWDVHRQGPTRVERLFRRKSRQVFGEGIFSGVHNTAHNELTNTEIWKTACNWWDQDRDYGQTDEDIIYPVRLGVACSCPRDVHYDMYYDRHYTRFYPKAIRDARYGGRIHYLGFHSGQVGADLRTVDFADHVRLIERKIRLLNHFNGPLPEMELLIVFGFPALANWFPDAAARSVYDINGSLGIMEKAQQVWEAGYICALAPSTAIDQGQIIVGPGGSPVYNGRRFKALAMLYPQYAKEATLAFLESYVAAGGKLMLEGQATMDFEGRDVSRRFAAISAGATVREFSPARLPELGIALNNVPNGCRLSDGSVVMTELWSILGGVPQEFRVEAGGATWEGQYTGVLALRADAGALSRFACGRFSSLRRDGDEVLGLSSPADVVLTRAADGRCDLLVGGAPGVCRVTTLKL